MINPGRQQNVKKMEVLYIDKLGPVLVKLFKSLLIK